MASPWCTATSSSAPLASPGGENLHGVHSTCTYFLTHTASERVELEIKCAHSVSWLSCSLKALDAVHSLPFGAWRFCTRLHPQKTEKLVTRKNNRSRCRRQSLALTPRYGLVHRRHCRRRPPSSSHASDPSMHCRVVSEGCYCLLPLSRNSRK